MADERWDVFVSYDHGDAEWVGKLAANLHRDGFNVFLDEWELVGGDRFAGRLEEAIRRSVNGVLVFSEHSLSRPWVREEYEALLQAVEDRSRRLIAVLYGEAELPAFLANRLWVDFRAATTSPGYLERLERLERYLRGKPARDRPARSGLGLGEWPTGSDGEGQDLLERLLGAEAGGTIARTRAGHTTREAHQALAKRRMQRERELRADVPAQRHYARGFPRRGPSRSSRSSRRLLLIASAMATAGGIAAAVIRWLIGGVVIPPIEAGRADDVDVTVFSPVEAAPGDAALVQVFIHLPAQARDARALATEFDTDARPRGFTSLSVPVFPGTELSFELRAPGLRVEEGLQTLKWRRRAQSVQFAVTIPESARSGSLIATLIVCRDSVPVGHVKFKLTISANGPRLASRARLAPAGDDARPYERAFASYAREDWSEVLRRVQVLKLKRLTRLRLFHDILDIDPGERWSQRLYIEIDNCDVVLLFWSRAAHDSAWVRREVRYALDRRATDFDPPEIVPVIIESPPCAPWPELAHQHFDDAIARLIADQ